MNDEKMNIKFIFSLIIGVLFMIGLGCTTADAGDVSRSTDTLQIGVGVEAHIYNQSAVVNITDNPTMFEDSEMNEKAQESLQENKDKINKILITGSGLFLMTGMAIAPIANKISKSR